MTKIICIYAIRCKANSKQYIGSAVSFKHRVAVHKNCLNKNKHPNRYLQFAWNKYGKENFEFYVVERLKDNKDLYIKEQYWIDTYQCLVPDGFNLDAVAGSRLGSKLSEEAKAKISAFHKGRVISNETRLKISRSLIHFKSENVIDSNYMKKFRPDKRKRKPLNLNVNMMIK